MWEIKDKIQVFKCYPFDVEELHFKSTDGTRKHPYYRLTCRDWVNVFAVTPERKAILIEQPRAGSLTRVLETPGGMIDPSENDATMAVARELEEETGYTSQRILPLASINPNPAIMNNKCHFFVALNCELNHQRKHFPDAEEDIHVVLKPLEEVEDLVRFGRVDHALSALCILLAKKYVNFSLS